MNNGSPKGKGVRIGPLFMECLGPRALSSVKAGIRV